MPLSDRIEFELAWNKTKSNLQDTSRIFVNDPYIVDILDRNKEEYVEHLENIVDNGYYPSESKIVDVPKANWNVRPGSVLSVDDLTVYSALVLAIYEDIRETIEWSAMDERYSRILNEDIEEKGWIKFPGKTWKSWNENTRELTEEHEYVVFTDITSFFENIEHRVLVSSLNELSDREEIISLIRKCLRRWSDPRERGLPQG